MIGGKISKGCENGRGRRSGIGWKSRRRVKRKDGMTKGLWEEDEHYDEEEVRQVKK